MSNNSYIFLEKGSDLKKDLKTLLDHFSLDYPQSLPISFAAAIILNRGTKKRHKIFNSTEY